MPRKSTTTNSNSDNTNSITATETRTNNKKGGSKKIRIEWYLQGANKAIRDANGAGFDPKLSIGAYYDKDSLRPASGLSMSEEKILLPEVIGVSSDDRDWHKQRDKFYHELTTRISKSGKLLEIGKEHDNEGGLTLLINGNKVDNFPLNVMDYIIYNHVKNHPFVEEDKLKASENANVKFIIVDDERELKRKEQSMKERRDALKLYHNEIDPETKEGKDKIKMYLVLWGQSIIGVTPQERSIMLDELVKDDPMKFMKLAKDKDQEIRYRIRTYITSGVLERIGESILNKESGELLGSTMAEAITWFKNKANETELLKFEQRHAEYMVDAI